MPSETTTTTTTETEEAAIASVEADVVLSVTPEATAKVLELRAGEEDPETLGLRVEVTGVNGPEYAYDLSFDAVAEASEGHHVSEQGGLTVLVPFDSVDQLSGAVLDLPSSPGQAGLVIRNPNRPNPLAGRHIELTGDIAEKVQQLLTEQINPALASHGGYAALAGVEDTTVFLTMGGGCQGCALSAATLREGIQVAIKEAIPEVTEIVDATDHAQGDNPFYT